MAGNTGSPLCAELNRIANYGVYPDRDDFLEEQGAANVWAGTTGQGLLGALNYIVDPTRTENNFSDQTKVCNELAGTTGLSDVDALRTIGHPAEVLLRGTTPQSAVWSIDADDSGFLYLPGVAGNYASTPDAAVLDITGDIDIRCKVAMTDWTPGATSTLIAKRNVNTAYQIFVTATTGILGFIYSIDGASVIQINSTVAPTVRDGETLWVRVTRNVSTAVVQFFTSTDGIVWTQLGADVASTPGNIYSSADGIEIGTRNGGTALPMQGKIFRAQVLRGINGTAVFDANFETSMTSQALTSFTESSGNNATVTINRTNYNVQPNVLNNFGKASSLLPVTVGSALTADSNDPILLSHTGTNYVYLPGVASNYLSVPDAPALQVVGDMDIRVQVSLDDWTPAATQNLISKWSGGGTSGQRSWILSVGTSGTLTFTISDTAFTVLSISSTVAPTVTDGTPLWVRVAYTRNTGAGQYSIVFFTSTNGTTWTQLGTTLTGTSILSTVYSTSPVELGTTFLGATGPAAGKIYRAQILNGIDGTTVLDVDTSVITSGADTYVVPTTYTGQAGAFFTGTGLSLNGVAGNYVSTPDSTPLDITGDLDLRCKVALDDWTPSVNNYLIAKFTPTGNQRSYGLYVGTTGTLTLLWSADGTALLSATSTVAPTVSDGATLWVRATLDVDNGASGRTTTFYTSTDGTTWTQLGSAVTTAGVTSIYSSTAVLEVGSQSVGTSGNLAGTIYRAQVFRGIDGTTAFDSNFETVSANALRMTESSTNRAVVTLNTTRYATINRATSGRKTVAVTQPTWLFGTDDYMEVNNRYMTHSPASENYVYLSGAGGNYMSVADAPPLDVTGDLDLRVNVALDDWTPSTANTLISKWNTTANNLSFLLRLGTDGKLVLNISSDGSTSLGGTRFSTASVSFADGAIGWVRATFAAATGNINFFTSTNGITWTQLGSTLTGSAGNIFSGTAELRVGAGNASGEPARGKFYRAQVRNGIDGTVVLDADASVITLPSQTTFVDRSSNAYTVTINKSGVGTFVSTGNYVYLPGVANNYISTPDSAALDITGDLDIRLKLALDDWTPSSLCALIAKVQTTSQRSYWLELGTSGRLILNWSTTGSNVLAATSTVSPTVADGETLWVRATLDVDNGAAGYSVIFYTSNDGLNWAQLGTTVTALGITSIYSSTSLLEIGSTIGGTNAAARGKFFRAQVLNGIGGTLVFDANFEGSITSLGQASFTESSTNGATVTINRAGSLYRVSGIIDAGYLYPGAINTFANSTTNFLDFSATDSFSWIIATREWADYGYNAKFYKATNNAQSGYGQYNNNGAAQTAELRSAAVNVGRNGAVTSSGTTLVSGALVNRTNQTITAITNGALSATSSIVTVSSLENPTQTLKIGTNGSGNFSTFELFGFAIFRNLLTSKNIADITNYFQRRD